MEEERKEPKSVIAQLFAENDNYAGTAFRIIQKIFEAYSYPSPKGR